LGWANLQRLAGLPLRLAGRQRQHWVVVVVLLMLLLILLVQLGASARTLRLRQLRRQLLLRQQVVLRLVLLRQLALLLLLPPLQLLRAGRQHGAQQCGTLPGQPLLHPQQLHDTLGKRQLHPADISLQGLRQRLAQQAQRAQASLRPWRRRRDAAACRQRRVACCCWGAGVRLQCSQQCR
jgi:hypothetical protein